MAAKRVPKGPDPVVLLAQGLVARLNAEKSQPTAPFPWTLRQLVASVAADASAATIEKAVKKKQFTDHAFLVKVPDKKGFPVQQAMDSPAALWEDAQALAGSRLTLEFLVRENPSASVARITKWVCAKPRKDFQTALAPPLSAFLYDALAARLVETIRQQRQRGETSYPLTLDHLASLAGVADRTAVAETIGRKAFTEAAFVLSPPRSGKSPTAAQQKALLGRLVALNEDCDKLVGSRAFLEGAIRACRDAKSVAFTLDDLAKKQFRGFVDKRLATQFVQAVIEKMSRGTLPPTVAWIKKSGKNHLFLVEDLSPPALRQRITAMDGAPPQAVAPSQTSASSYPSRFDAEFRRLDRQRGSNNFVWLFELRDALPEFTREQFDGGLRQLREARRFKLNAGEGHYGMSQQQSNGSIREAGTVYLSVSRIES